MQLNKTSTDANGQSASRMSRFAAAAARPFRSMLQSSRFAANRWWFQSKEKKAFQVCTFFLFITIFSWMHDYISNQPNYNLLLAKTLKRGETAEVSGHKVKFRGVDYQTNGGYTVMDGKEESHKTILFLYFEADGKTLPLSYYNYEFTGTSGSLRIEAIPYNIDSAQVKIYKQK